MSADLERRVKAGAELLDTVFPAWPNMIDLDNLRMASSQACVLGQVYGSYNKGLEELGILHGMDRRVEYGFTNPGFDDSWYMMTILWTLEVVKRTNKET